MTSTTSSSDLSFADKIHRCVDFHKTQGRDVLPDALTPPPRKDSTLFHNMGGPFELDSHNSIPERFEITPEDIVYQVYSPVDLSESSMATSLPWSGPVVDDDHAQQTPMRTSIQDGYGFPPEQSRLFLAGRNLDTPCDYERDSGNDYSPGLDPCEPPSMTEDNDDAYPRTRRVTRAPTDAPSMAITEEDDHSVSYTAPRSPYPWTTHDMKNDRHEHYTAEMTLPDSGPWTS